MNTLPRNTDATCSATPKVAIPADTQTCDPPLFQLSHACCEFAKTPVNQDVSPGVRALLAEKHITPQDTTRVLLMRCAIVSKEVHQFCGAVFIAMLWW